MTTLNLWQCDTCSRTYATDVATCTAPTCTGIMPLSAKERLICDAFRRAGVLDALVEAARQQEPLNRGEAPTLHRFDTTLVMHTLRRLQCDIANAKENVQ